MEHPSQVGVFPDAREEDDVIDPEAATFADPATRHSYQGVEDCEHALAEVRRLADCGFLEPCATLEECRQRLDGEDPVVSKFGQVVKEKAGEVKRRLILDSRESGVTPVARKNQTIELPSVNELVFDGLAESIEPNEDQTVWTVTLKEGRSWHNGEPVTAENFANAWTSSQDPKNAQATAGFRRGP